MNTNEKGLSFSKILDELISAKALKDLHLLTQKELELKVPKLTNKQMSATAAPQLCAFLKNINLLIKKVPEFLIDEISTIHPNLLSAPVSSDTLAPTILPSQTEEVYTVEDILENQTSMFPPINVVKETQVVENIVSVDTDSVQKILNLESELLELRNELTSKDVTIFNLESQLATYENTDKNNSTELDIQYNNSFTMNNALNYSSFDSTLVDIKIPKDLIIQSSYFIDTNRIVNLPTLIKLGKDIDSEIVKIILTIILKNYKLI